MHSPFKTTPEDVCTKEGMQVVELSLHETESVLKYLTQNKQNRQIKNSSGGKNQPAAGTRECREPGPGAGQLVPCQTRALCLNIIPTSTVCCHQVWGFEKGGLE